MTRKSKREIEQQLEEIEEGPPGDYPHLDNLSLFFGYEWDFESVGKDRLVEREKDGKVFYFPEEFETALRENLSDG
jgi:hypothetical protein